MPTRPPRVPFDPWRDVDGTPIPVQCRIEQIAVNKEHGALPSRLHQQGQVIGRGTSRLLVRFDDNKLISLRPHLVRVLTTEVAVVTPSPQEGTRSVMIGLAEITLVGILVTDPELRFTSTGIAVANFTVAANDHRYDPATGQWVDTGTTFLPCTIRRQAAENAAESLAKGIHVLITGVLRQREWETTDSDKRYAYEVDATEVGISLKHATARLTMTVPETTRERANHGNADEPPL